MTVKKPKNHKECFFNKKVNFSVFIADVNKFEHLSFGELNNLLKNIAFLSFAKKLNMLYNFFIISLNFSLNLIWPWQKVKRKTVIF